MRKPRIANVVVPERMLSLAIGREGQNARLAAKLTGWRIDIRSDVSVAEAALAEAALAAAAEAEAKVPAEPAAPSEPAALVSAEAAAATEPADATDPEIAAKPRRHKAAVGPEKIESAVESTPITEEVPS